MENSKKQGKSPSHNMYYLMNFWFEINQEAGVSELFKRAHQSLHYALVHLQNRVGNHNKILLLDYDFKMESKLTARQEFATCLNDLARFGVIEIIQAGINQYVPWRVSLDSEKFRLYLKRQGSITSDISPSISPTLSGKDENVEGTISGSSRNQQGTPSPTPTASPLNTQQNRGIEHSLSSSNSKTSLKEEKSSSNRSSQEDEMTTTTTIDFTQLEGEVLLRVVKKFRQKGVFDICEIHRFWIYNQREGKLNEGNAEAFVDGWIGRMGITAKKNASEMTFTPKEHEIITALITHIEEREFFEEKKVKWGIPELTLELKKLWTEELQLTLKEVLDWCLLSAQMGYSGWNENYPVSLAEKFSEIKKYVTDKQTTDKARKDKEMDDMPF